MSSKKIDFLSVAAVIARNDPRYDKGAYEFMRLALDNTLDAMAKKQPDRANKHINAQELLEGIRAYAIAQYGPMTLPLLHQWGIRSGRDFGNIVFNLVEYGLFGKTDSDSLEDFNTCYDFSEAFEKPFLPRNRPKVG